MLQPSQNHRVRHRAAALADPTDKIWIAQLAPQAPPSAQPDKLVIEMATCAYESGQCLSFPRAAGFAPEPTGSLRSGRPGIGTKRAVFYSHPVKQGRSIAAFTPLFQRNPAIGSVRACRMFVRWTFFRTFRRGTLPVAASAGCSWQPLPCCRGRRRPARPTPRHEPRSAPHGPGQRRPGRAESGRLETDRRRVRTASARGISGRQRGLSV